MKYFLKLLIIVMSNLFRRLNTLLSSFKPKLTIFQEYRHNAFGKYLLFTNIISSGIPMCLGDLIQQEIEFQTNKLSKRYDYKRLGRMFLVGLTFGPLHHYYYIKLNKYLPERNINTIFKKIMLDQFFMGPICIACFFTCLGVLEWKSLDDINMEIRKKFLGVYLMDWCLWPPTQFINFYFVPVRYQVLYINLVTVLYDVFLSYMKHKDTAPDKIQHYDENISIKEYKQN